MSPAAGPPSAERAAGALLDAGHPTDSIGGRDLTAWPSTAGQVLLRAAHRAARTLAPHQVWALVLAAGLLLDGVVVVLGAWLYRALVDGDGVDAVDHPVLRAAVEHRTSGVTGAAQVVSDVAGTVGMTLLAAATAVVFALVRRRWTPLGLVVSAMLGSLALTVAGELAVGRTRPPLVDAVPPYQQTPSFPSGHTLNATVFAGVVTYVLLRELSARWARTAVVVLAVAFALVVGASRVYLGHHWLTDVLVAWLLGASWVAVVVTGHRLHLTLRRHPAVGQRH